MLCSMACLWSQCPGWWPVPRLWFMVGCGFWAQPAALLQTGIWGSPRTGRVDGAEWNSFMGIGGGSWSWILVCGCRRSSGCQLHLDWVVVTDCQGLQEGKRWEMLVSHSPLTLLLGLTGQSMPCQNLLPAGGGTLSPAPRHLTHKALMERWPGVTWGGHWEGAPCPPSPHGSSGGSVPVIGC